MRRPAALLTALLAAAALTSCAAEDEGGAGSAPPDSTTAMDVEEGARLEFRLVESAEGAEDTEGCLAKHPETGGTAPASDAGPDEPVTACANFDGVLYEATFAPAFVTGDQVSYVDFDYGTAGIPTVYVVFEDEGVDAWKAATADGFGTVAIMVGGALYRTTGVQLSPNDIHQIEGIGTIEEAEAIATALATGEP
ncbi:hypothetical protein [Glycomyces paridis]|uniref:Uncharacterized protein n=1 Tax=Glycomyces paridis TaxID=2126555 RepID=A0A4S8PAG1_9ACTN|nr:hypothetical protein [Glycomyces paridis]THV26535.1 hypothetical protein E9998_18440 [Glycomyces paridis]